MLRKSSRSRGKALEVQQTSTEFVPLWAYECIHSYNILRYLLLLDWKKSHSLHLLYFPFSVFHSVSIASISFAMQEFGFRMRMAFFRKPVDCLCYLRKVVHLWSSGRWLVYVLGIFFVFFNARGRELDMLIRTRHSSHSRMWSRLSSCFWVKTKWFVPCWTRRKVPRPGPQNCEVDFQLRSSASLGKTWNAKWCCCLAWSMSFAKCCHMLSCWRVESDIVW